MARQRPLAVASRNATIRDFFIFQLKLALDGGKDFFALWLSTGAIILDFIAGRGKRPRLFYSVVRMSERFDKWLNLHSVMDRLEEGRTEDGLFGAQDMEEGNLVKSIEDLVRDKKKIRGPRDDA